MNELRKPLDKDGNPATLETKIGDLEPGVKIGAPDTTLLSSPPKEGHIIILNSQGETVMMKETVITGWWHKPVVKAAVLVLTAGLFGGGGYVLGKRNGEEELGECYDNGFSAGKAAVQSEIGMHTTP